MARSTYVSSNLLTKIALLAVVVLAVPCFGVTPAPFTATNPIGGAPIGWSYAGNKFVGTILGDGTGRLYSTDLTGGSIAPFGGSVNLAASYGQEHYVSSSLGLGGFPSRDIYVAEGNNIEHITNAGVPDATPFINGSSGGINGDVRGITFDAVGTFGFQMLVTTHTGFVYEVSPAGIPTQIASTGEDTEGLDVAPVGAGALWGTHDGSLFISSEGSGKIRAIDPGSFTMTTMATVPSAEELDFVPLNLGASGNPLEGLYGANYNKNNVLKMGANQFTGLQGTIIVTGETTSDINDVTGINTYGVVGTFGGYPANQPEDGLFVTADVIRGGTVPEPASLSLLGISGIAMLSRRRRRMV